MTELDDVMSKYPEQDMKNLLIYCECDGHTLQKALNGASIATE